MELERKLNPIAQSSLEDNVLELRKHCERMWQGLQENKINNWWGVQHCIDHIDQKRYHDAAGSLLSMYGGMGSFSDLYLPKYSGEGNFYESQSVAYNLAVDIQLKLDVLERQNKY
mmetsp:Transcript_23874/g.42354  ORF Transcript_23874/g.42354 Transcript_23874/m.42354 type:complete len:115 (-) Transcript_23874:34-378(-)